MTQSKYTYVIARGQYSDYRVLCACPSKAKAKALATKMNALKPDYQSPYMVEALPKADESVERIATLYLEVEIRDGGGVGDETQRETLDWPFEMTVQQHKEVQWMWRRISTHQSGVLTVYGTDPERVRHVFGEKKAWLQYDLAARRKGILQG